MVTVEPPEILRGEEPRRTFDEWIKTKEAQEAVAKVKSDRAKKAAKARKRKRKAAK
jgi:hypothetical protein